MNWTTILQVAVATAIAVVFASSVEWYLDLPVVHRSTATGECVSVDAPEHRYTCQTVPDWPTLTRWVP